MDQDIKVIQNLIVYLRVFKSDNEMLQDVRD